MTGTGTGQSTAVTWSVQEGSSGGSVDAGGRDTAPFGTGTFHVVATRVADGARSGSATVSVTSSGILDPDRRTAGRARPGLGAAGGRGVEPTGATKLDPLPARVRDEAGTPCSQP